MKKLNPLLIVLCIVMLSNTAKSQDLNLTYSDGNVILPLAASPGMTIDQNTGDINITTTQNAASIGTSLGLQPTGNAPVISPFTFSLNGGNSVATINATITEEAVYCKKSGLWGTGVYTSNPPTSFVTNVSGQATSNSSDYSLTCANSYGKTTESITISGIVIVSAPQVTISASSTSVNSGDSSTVSVTIANSPTSCSFTGTNAQWPAGVSSNTTSFNFLVSNITSSQTYTVSCTNSAGTSTPVSANIDLIGQNAWPSCSGASASILNNNQDRSILTNFDNTAAPYDYDGLFSHLQGVGQTSDWPGSFGDIIHLTLNPNKYVSAKFTVPTGAGNDAKFVVQIPSNWEGPPANGRTISISDCPGDFSQHLNQTRCKTNGSTLFWSSKVNPLGPPNYFCELQQGQTYYLNVVHSNNAANNNYATTNCNATSGYCGLLAVMNSVVF